MTNESYRENPNSKGFWRRNTIMALREELSWHREPAVDPEDQMHREEMRAELAIWVAQEEKVLARYRGMNRIATTHS